LTDIPAKVEEQPLAPTVSDEEPGEALELQIGLSQVPFHDENHFLVAFPEA
jgi:hypothetical protein